MRRWFCSAALSLAMLVRPAMASGEDWKLVFEDNFERAEPGPNYLCHAGTLRIQDGRLLLLGSGSVALIDRPWAMDVQVEFDAEAWPEELPCDLSVTINSNREGRWKYLLGFGAQNNRANHLIGPGLRVVDEHPPFLIEHGKVYHMVARREGKTLSYTVNGTCILEGTGDLVGGPMFNRVGFVTWGGMLIDNVKVYERATPHPDTPTYLESLPGLPLEREGREVKAIGAISPEAKQAVDALNRGDFAAAREGFSGLADVQLRLAGLAYLYGDLNYYERPVYGDLGTSRDFGELGAFAAEWENEARAHPDDTVLQAYLPAVRSFGKLVLSRGGSNDALILVGVGAEHNPFYYKARLFQARYIYWDAMEGANQEAKNRAHQIMRELLKLWPDNRVLNEYVGKAIPWGEELNADVEHHPAWAAYLRETYARELAVLERFCETRQMPDGQFGGGWGDDVEMMRRWVPIAAISTCAHKVQAGIDLLTEGIWKHTCTDGYDSGLGDVEHSSEPTADTFPTMLLLRYGDPRYYEFNLRTAKTIRDRFMALDANGFPRFRSTEFGAKGVHEGLSGGGDTGYHARAMKHFLWLAWYGNPDARDWYVGWADGWRRVAMIDEPTKPVGVLPGTLWYPSGDYNSPDGKPWYSPQAHNYYGDMGMPVMLHQTFLAAYVFTGDSKFLQPFLHMMDIATAGPLVRGETTPGTRDWIYAKVVHQASAALTSVYRMLTGERVYDEYTRRFGTAAQNYQIDHDLDRYLGTFERAAKSLRHNLWYFTTEVESTDRLHLPAVENVWGAYTGAITTTVDAEMPTFAVTYETPSADFAALVVENTPSRLRIWFYTFWDKPTPIALRVWQLRPGRYTLMQGPILPGEFPFQKRYGWGEPTSVEVKHRAERIGITLPAGTEYAIDLRLEEPIEVPALAADLAVASRDLRVDGQKLVATVHNIGNASAEGAEAQVRVRTSSGEWQAVGHARLPYLPEPADLEPSITEAAFDLPAGVNAKDIRVVLDPQDKIYEITEDNNIVVAGMP